LLNALYDPTSKTFPEVWEEIFWKKIGKQKGNNSIVTQQICIKGEQK
jgi:hypothetical protein